MGRPAAPTSIKKLQGITRKDRLNKNYLSVDHLVEIPESPFDLNEGSQELFNEYCSMLIPLKLLTRMDLVQLSHLSRLDYYIDKCWLSGDPCASAYMTLSKQLANDFGLTVLSREKIKPKTSNTDITNKWDKTKNKK